METQKIDRKRKIDHDQDSTAIGFSLCEMFEAKHHPVSEKTEGWDVLQSILETRVLQAKLSNKEAAISLLVKWFRSIASDTEKLRLFRQWVIPSSPNVKQELDEHAECKSTTVSSTNVSSSTTYPSSLASILNSSNSGIVKDESLVIPHSPQKYCSSSSSSTGTLTPDSTPSKNTADNSPSSNGQQVLLQRLLQQQQQQIVLLQQLQKQSPSKSSGTSDGTAQSATSISVFPRAGGPGTLLTVSLKGAQAHPRAKCECTLGFIAAEGTTTVRRIGGGSDSDLLFTVPQIHVSSSTTSVPVVVHLKLCTSDEPVMCLEPFFYSPRERSLGSSQSDEDSEELCEETAADGEEDEGSPPPQALPPSGIPNANCPTPKQMMTIRERIVELTHQRGNRSGPRLAILQQPSVRVVWKNRRLDIPFKLKVENLEDLSTSGSNPFSALTPAKLCILAVVADHKGRLQMDAAENFAEEFSAQGIAHFSNLRMTKGTWGKEWCITFAAVVKASLNNPVVVAISPPCPIVVKTRKNPQVRHNKAETSPPVAFIERKNSDPAPVVRAKRHRVEDLLDHRPPSPPPRASSHFEDMASLLAAAELKQKEQQEEEEQPCLPLMKPESELSFNTFQNLMSYLEDVKSKHQISLGVIEQPLPKRDSKILIVKKGKPFRVPFQIQLRSTAVRHNPQNYVCVAVVRNDKGEEVAVRNSEVPFDWKGMACFAGLMVMKGTWGKAVQLTFEARWDTKRGVTAEPPSWSTQRMMVVSETAPTQLLCYTKDKKSN